MGNKSQGRSDPGSDLVHLPSETRYLAAACEALGLTFRDVSGEGYLVEVTDGLRTIALAAGRACIYPTNTAAAFTLTKDKMHTSRLLEAHGVPTLGGALFFVSGHHRKYRPPGREQADAIRHAEAHGYPLFAKPNLGARGDLAEIVWSTPQLERLMAEAATRYDAIILQEVVAGPEHRVFCLGGEAVFCVERAVAALTGDGHRSLGELIDLYNAGLSGSGISGLARETYGDIARVEGLSLEDVPAKGRSIPLPGRRNLAAAGRAERLLLPVPVRLADIALAAARLTGLHVAGIDLMDVGGTLRVIEVNGAPGMTALEQLGRMDLILDIWRRILGRAFGRELG
jgi:cyanophycin synthetase